ncbi:lytic transglycosylase domain-containing protein [Pedobacter antarcticus]|uniref:Murein transglycosylase n=2 Tax=Pedobacter antarcticus TaxID=34086 RepID=A0A081PH59_9SPHI|nr:lytic transglycosylase domain-containing protein [Pedobacter antarcticus]KEQ30032.1 murein transglycosylase [Pedobacter antarcticus 4BY]SDM01758.1 Transglycosylase SLT domain-containing protein [Pedobacter antarcticus]SFF30114.1 Transglycosylase SLT domain-containing protein [Pedobacter antarcticus]
MIKKHIITSTVILGLLVMAKVFAYNMPQASKSQKNNNNTLTETVTTVTTTTTKKPVSMMAKLNFAEESLPLGDRKVERKMKTILAAHSFSQLQTNQLHRKAEEWFPIIEPILAAYGIPDDFKYVPLVESGLKGGMSPKGANGFWQFMPGTARSYGLTVNSEIDERKNLRKSTIAACKYIKELYGIFDSWTLVAAAYNVGDNHMRRQINKQNQDNYFKMKLNRETAGYVYKLISMKEILNDPGRHGYRTSGKMLAMQTTVE